MKFASSEGVDSTIGLGEIQNFISQYCPAQISIEIIIIGKGGVFFIAINSSLFVC